MSKSTTLLLNVLDEDGPRAEKIDSFVEVVAEKIGTVVITDLTPADVEDELTVHGELTAVLAPTLKHSKGAYPTLSNQGEEELEIPYNHFFIEWSSSPTKNLTTIVIKVLK